MDFRRWRAAARPLLSAGVAPDSVFWNFSSSAVTDPSSGESTHSRPPRIAASLMRLLESVALFRDPGRWDLMYRLAWRSVHENPRLSEDAADSDVHRATLMERAVNRDVHKMHAFVRFRESKDALDAESYFAWYEPEHEILQRAAGFFAERFSNMQWTIATPDGAAIWRLRQLKILESPTRVEPREDPFEDLWRTYYRSICNLARINTAAMRREMPQRFWNNLPEAAEIPRLVREGTSGCASRWTKAGDEELGMAKAVKRSLGPPLSAAENPDTCRRCDLWKHATQAVAGEGPPHSKIMLVGEQPGDEEDLRGHPFVGPAGRVLDQAIEAAGLQRRDIFITNAVKHFKWEPRGKRRLHKKPGATEINACQVWLEQEIKAMAPSVILALGATALRALTGTSLSIESARRQELRHPDGSRVMATYHPSAILRAEGDRAAELRAFLESDLRAAANMAAASLGTGE